LCECSGLGASAMKGGPMRELVPEFAPLSLLAVVLVVVWLLNTIKILREYERGVIFRLGRLLPQPKGPGLILVFWPIDRMVRVSLRVVRLEVPPQDIITQDNVSVKVNAVVYFRVSMRSGRSWKWRTICMPLPSWL